MVMPLPLTLRAHVKQQQRKSRKIFPHIIKHLHSLLPGGDHHNDGDIARVAHKGPKAPALNLVKFVRGCRSALLKA
jgi:hypothetical protein